VRSPATMARLIWSPVVPVISLRAWRQLEVRLPEGLLHGLEMRGTLLQELGAMAERGP
jgi:hypothetical protein